MLGITVLIGVVTVIGSLLADLAYAVLDPRVRFA
jgi:peptide/nickel transport system permease protein